MQKEYLIIPSIVIGLMVFAGIVDLIVEDNKEGEKQNKVANADKKQNYSDSHEKWQNIDKSKQKQQKRKELIQKLINKDVIDKVETSNNYINIYVRPSWHQIKFNTKESFVDVIVSYYYVQDPDMNMATIKDPYTDKKIGQFSSLGLKLE